MKLEDILKSNLVIDSLRATTKPKLLSEMADHLCEQLPQIQTPSSIILDYLNQREDLGSTGIGQGIAIPHTKVPGLNDLIACFGRSTEGVEYNAIDDKPVHLIFMLLIPENSAGMHLKALARISRILKDADFRARLLTLESSQAVYDAFIDREREF
jgi:PTS system nitrogen regulatory IIA component